MKRRDFARTTLLGMGGTALLSGAAARAVPDEVPAGLKQAASGGQTAGLAVRVGKTVEITHSFRRCWFPTVHQFSNGSLMATMRMSPDEVNPEGDFSAYCISKDHGATWSRRYTMGAGSNVDGAWSQTPEPDGSLWQLYGWTDPYPQGQARNFHLTLTKFSQSGMEIQQRRNVPLRMSETIQMTATKLFGRQVQDGELAREPVVVAWGPILKSRRGGLMAPVYYTAERDPRYYRLALIRSNDGGGSWREGSTIAAVEPGAKPWPGMGSEGPCEAGLVRLADGRLLALFRTGGDGFIGAAWSSDDGGKWTSPVSLPYQGVALRVRRLANGVLACTTGRPGPVVVMFSVDGAGETWSHVTPIFPGKSTHYTDFVEVEPGRLLVVYDNVPYGWYSIPYADRKSRNVIYGTFVDVRKP
ncbi:MAG TPA: sialidase family protein [Terriglobia bacterium]|nr:sialidase family protein [Terriglobia bacterium]